VHRLNSRETLTLFSQTEHLDAGGPEEKVLDPLNHFSPYRLVQVGAGTQETLLEAWRTFVQAGGRRGLLLPDLEGVDTVDYQVSIAMQKAGIPPGTRVDLSRFEVRRYGEEQG